MKERVWPSNWYESYREWLYTEERSRVTVEKYARDVRRFYQFAWDKEIVKETIIAYKEQLIVDGYATVSINSMLAALNSLLRFLGWEDCMVKTIKVQRATYCPESKELSRDEYRRLVVTAIRNEDVRMALLLQTLCCTGMRISELKFVTLEAVRQGEASVSCKGKCRKIYLVPKLCQKLYDYAEKKQIHAGMIFRTNTGRPMDRSNIWRDMKRLSREAGVEDTKVTPHALRHLFARTFYEQDKDIAKLADILGHSSINTTRIYILTTERRHRMCMEQLNLMLD